MGRFSGITFLLADVALVLFAYVKLGGIPQSLWWGGLGLLFLGSWILIEYKKEWILRIKNTFTIRTKQWQEELKSWN